MIRFLIFLIITAKTLFTKIINEEDRLSHCRPINVPLCGFLTKIGYNATQFPNSHNHRNVHDAINELYIYETIFETKCSEQLPYFLCSTFFPYCAKDSNYILKPCRSLCINARRNCEPIMLSYGLPWLFDCNSYPDEDKEEKCLGISLNKTEIDFSSKRPATVARSVTKIRGRLRGQEGKTLTIICPTNYEIIIRKVVHIDSKCCSDASKVVLSAICQNKSSCIFKITQDTFGGHCQNKVGSVIVKYKCSKRQNTVKNDRNQIENC